MLISIIFSLILFFLAECSEDLDLEAPPFFRCIDCLKVFAKKDILKRHRIYIHGYGSSFVCRKCRTEFTVLSEMKVHRRECGAEKKKLGYQAYRTCRICKNVMSSGESLLVHFQMDHPGIAPFKCLKCGAEFQTKSDKSYHVCDKSKSVICDQCGDVLTNNKLLASHMHRIHNQLLQETFACTHCNELFSSKELLRSHLKIHESYAAVACTVCGLQLSSERNLEIHMNIHTKARLYMCPSCDKKFLHSSSLKTHLRTHTGEKPWKCYVCGRCFADRHNLTTHKRTHTGEKPYSCVVCNKTFAQLSAMKQHSKLHRERKLPAGPHA